MTRAEQSAHLRPTSTPLLRWARRSFVRDAVSFLGQSLLFAGSVGSLLAVVAMLLRLF